MKRIFNILNSNFLVIILIPLLLSLFLIFNKPAYQQQYPKAYDLQVLPIVLQYLDRYYVDPQKIDPNLMLIEGLNKLESSLDEVLVDFNDPENSSDFTIQVNNNIKEYNNLEIYDLENVGDVVQDVFAFVIPHLKNEDIETIDIEYVLTDKMLKTLDQHSGIITPEVYKEFMIETEGSFGGLGIVIGIRDGQLTVISPIEGTPAYIAGIKPNDKIVQIENESTINMSLIEAVSKLRGKKGTPVNIFVLRESFTNPKEFKITRDTIRIESVEDFVLDDNILYLRIRDFQKNTLQSLADAIKKRGNNVNGVILDLRGNPGGLLDQAEKVSDLFLSTGTVVTTKIGNSKKSYNAKFSQPEYEGEVVVLVDSGSASASEIVAGALKNNQRAIIIGERTFGKGSVQQIFDLRDGSALKLTIASYLTPGDISIQDIGITPDIKIKPAIISEEDVLYGYINTGEKEPETEESLYYLKYLDQLPDPENEETPEEALSKEEKKIKISEDFSVRLAKEILLNTDTTNSKEVLNTSNKVISGINLIEEEKIEARWKEIGIDWSRGDTLNTDPDISVNILPQKPEFKAGDKSSVTVSVTNKGKEPIHRLIAATVSDNPIFDGKELIYGQLLPEQTRKWKMNFEIPKWVNTRNDKIDLKFFQTDYSEIPGSSFDITTIGNDKPLFAYKFEIVDDGRFGSTGNGNGKPESDEEFSLVFDIKNIGQGVSDKTVVTLKNLSGDSVFLELGRFEFDDFKPGSINSAPFLFKILDKNVKDIKFELTIVDEVFREVLTSKIDISGLQSIGKFSKASGSAVVIKDNTALLAGGFESAPIIGLSNKTTEFALLGYNNEYAKVSLSKDQNAWINKKGITLTENEIAPGSETLVNDIFYSQPRIDILNTPLTTNEDEIILSGIVKDNDKIENISVFKGEDKIKLITPNKNNQSFTIKLQLDDGINVFNVIAKDSHGLFSKQTVTIRKSDLS